MLDLASRRQVIGNFSLDHERILGDHMQSLLMDERFLSLDSQEKNRILTSLSYIKATDQQTIEKLINEEDLVNLKEVVEHEGTINDTLWDQIQTIDITQIQSRVEHFSEESEFESQFNGLLDAPSWNDTSIFALPEVNSQVIKTELLDELERSDSKSVDSLSQYLDALNKKYEKEEYIQEGVEELKLREKSKGILPKDTYVDFIIGYAQGEHSVLNLSPNFGYNFTADFSAGIGITFQHTFDKQAYTSSVLGYKVFGKYEFLKKRLFAIVENVFLIPNISYFNPPEGIETFEFTTLIGGGYALNIFKQKVLTISLHYNFNDEMPAPALSSPWLMRFGIDIF
jgi:hypothetical protein